MEDNTKFVLKEFLRFIIYAVSTILLLLLMFGITHLDFARVEYIPELSLTEVLQEILLFVCVGIFCCIAHKNKIRGLWLVAGFLSCMLVRELDILFDMIFHGAWKFIALPAAVFFICLALRNGISPVIDDLAAFMRKKSYPFLISSLLLLLFVSRIFGSMQLIKLVAPEHCQFALKNFMEEGIELVSYFLLFISSCAYYYEYRIKGRMK